MSDLQRLQTAVLALLLLILWTTGCQPATIVLPATATSVPPTAVANEAAAFSKTNSTLPSPSATAAVTAIPTTTPMPTPLPPITLAVPPDWLPVAEPAIQQPAQAGNRQWQLVTSADPAAALAGDRANVALVNDASGIVIKQKPVALAVPLVTNWENVTEAEAERIVAHGDAAVTVVEWTKLDATHKALRIDGRFPTDPGYPLQNTWSLVAAPGYETAAARIAPLLQAQVPPEPLVHLTAVGDIMLDRALGHALQEGKVAYPFANVTGLLAAADVTMGNLECALGSVGEPAPKSYTFRAPPQAAAALALAGFDIMTLANNHALDYGPEALLQGISLLREQGIATIGAGANEVEAYAPYVTEVNGLTVAFLGYVNVPVEVRGFDTAVWTATAATPGMAWGDPARIQADVTAVRPQADVVVVALHSGYEYVEEPSENQVAAARTAIDGGADLVIGHHAHILQGIEFYKEGVIVYGLGNFAFEIDGEPETAVLNAWLDKDGVRQLEIVPAVIQFGGQPRPAESWEALAIRQRVYRLTTLLNTQYNP